MRILRPLAMAAALLMATTAIASELPRRGGAVNESYTGIRMEYGSLAVADNVRLRTLLSLPERVERPPVILFVQWLSCDTVELRPDRTDGWTQMLRGMIQRSGWAVMRTDKRGIGDSEGGPCEALDYDTELADHRKALQALLQRNDIDTGRVVVFGASMGARMAPQVAAGQPSVVGVLTWGGGSKTWFERMLAFDRNAMELGGRDPAEIARNMREHAEFHAEYLLRGSSPPVMIEREPALAAVWSDIIGTSPDLHYGRPFAFHHQAQAADWSAAWGRVSVPVLVTMGEFDWFENRPGHESPIRIVNRGNRDLARLVIIPRMDHHFSLFDGAEAAFADETGTPDAEPFLEVALAWLQDL